MTSTSRPAPTEHKEPFTKDRHADVFKRLKQAATETVDKLRTDLGHHYTKISTNVKNAVKLSTLVNELIQVSTLATTKYAKDLTYRIYRNTLVEAARLSEQSEDIALDSSELATAHDSLKSKAGKDKAALDAATSKLSTLQPSLESATGELAETKNQLAQLKTELEALRMKMSGATTNDQTKTNEIQQLRSALQTETDNHRRATEQNRELTKQLLEETSRNRRTEEELAATKRLLDSYKQNELLQTTRKMDDERRKILQSHAKAKPSADFQTLYETYFSDMCRSALEIMQNYINANKNSKPQASAKMEKFRADFLAKYTDLQDTTGSTLSYIRELTDTKEYSDFNELFNFTMENRQSDRKSEDGNVGVEDRLVRLGTMKITNAEMNKQQACYFFVETGYRHGHFPGQKSIDYADDFRNVRKKNKPSESQTAFSTKQRQPLGATNRLMNAAAAPTAMNPLSQRVLGTAAKR